MKAATKTIPIVFGSGGDPVAAGLVTNLARPGANVTGFSLTEPSLGGKWLDLLKELAPRATRVAVVYAPENPVRAQYSRAIEAVNARLRVELSAIEANDGAQLERDIRGFGRGPRGALLVLPGPSTIAHRDAIIAAAMGAYLPAIYPFPHFVKLMSYGTDVNDAFRRAATYVDRILRGEKPGDLPVQQPTRFELLINLKAAKALGLRGAINAARARRRGDRVSLASAHRVAASAHGSNWHVASAAKVLSLRQLWSELRKFDDKRPWPALARLTRGGH